jgi:hypothetical protein
MFRPGIKPPFTVHNTGREGQDITCSSKMATGQDNSTDYVIKDLKEDDVVFCKERLGKLM